MTVNWNGITAPADLVVITGADGVETVLYKDGLFDELNALLDSMTAGFDAPTRALHDARVAETDREFAAIGAAGAAAVAGMFKGRPAR
jgi:hypothetical protein